ncbi:MAG: HU family DNA-binding protein [Prevotella sp.]|nr:HU family DNA-binding protein [Prevotella sp.]
MGIEQSRYKKAREADIESITQEVKKGETVALVGFGTFSVSERAARKGINPQTKVVINIPAKKIS